MTSLPVRISGSQRRSQRTTSACYFNGKERDSLIDQLHATSPDGLERVVRGATRRVDDEISTLWAGTATRVRALASCTAASLTIRARERVEIRGGGFVVGGARLVARVPHTHLVPKGHGLVRVLRCDACAITSCRNAAFSAFARRPSGIAPSSEILITAR